MTRKQKKQLIKILVSMVIFVLTITLPLNSYLKMAGFLICYVIIGYDIVFKAVSNIFAGQVFDENFLMTVATIGAMCLGDYAEGVAVMVFYQVGELFQSYAVSKSRKSIAGLMDIRPDYANVIRNEKEERVSPEEVGIGEIIVVKPGERIPLDGTVTEGSSLIDTSALTGESLPRQVEAGEDVISGCINQNATIYIKITKKYEESTVAKILELVENASSKKSKSEAFITRFAKYYTPAVVIGAVLLAVIPPIVMGNGFSTWIHRALTFLVISCPCALVISIPLSFFGGIGGASRCGVLIKGSNYLEALSKAGVVVFDKTGTLTKGSFKVTDIKPVRLSEEELLELAAYAEKDSSHPISKSIKKAYEDRGRIISSSKVSDIKEEAGYGVYAKLDGRLVIAGNDKMMQKENIKFEKLDSAGTVVYVARDGFYEGAVIIEDELKPDAVNMISALKNVGIRKTVILTGDSERAGKKAADTLGVDEVYTKLLPADKVTHIEELMNNKGENEKLVFVGDGINDAPVLARADIGIAMGGLGSDAAIEAADVVIMTDEPSKLVTAVKISRKTLRIVKENIVFALGVKFLVLILGALGIASMWAAVFADVGVAVIAILNAIRALNVSKSDSIK